MLLSGRPGTRLFDGMARFAPLMGKNFKVLGQGFARPSSQAGTLVLIHPGTHGDKHENATVGKNMLFQLEFKKIIISMKSTNCGNGPLKIIEKRNEPVHGTKRHLYMGWQLHW